LCSRRAAALALVVAALVVAALAPQSARADGDIASDADDTAVDAVPQERPRAVHWAVAIGGFGALTGPAGRGPAALAELYPGGRLGRLGFALRFRGFENLDAGMALAGLSFEAGASRPTLTMALHAEAGLAYGPRCGAAGGGLRTQLGVAGPLVLIGDVTGHVVGGGCDVSLALAASFYVGLAR
jgi:hypothetical protein